MVTRESQRCSPGAGTDRDDAGGELDGGVGALMAAGCWCWSPLREYPVRPGLRRVSGGYRPCFTHFTGCDTWHEVMSDAPCSRRVTGVRVSHVWHLASRGDGCCPYCAYGWRGPSMADNRSVPIPPTTRVSSGQNGITDLLPPYRLSSLAFCPAPSMGPVAMGRIGNPSALTSYR